MLVTGLPNVTFVEGRAHFGAWAIVSSPLVLSLDLLDEELLSTWWPVIANPEALAINDAWFGGSGSLWRNDSDSGLLGLYKPMARDGSSAAVLLLNSGNLTLQNVSISFDDIPGFAHAGRGVAARDVWARAGAFAGPLTGGGLSLPSPLESHDSVFYVLTSVATAGGGKKAAAEVA